MSDAPKPKWTVASVTAARQRLQQRKPANPSREPTDWRFHDAAAVLSWFEIHPTLYPLGRDVAADTQALARLIEDSICSSDSDGRRRFILKSDVRKQALVRLGSWERIAAALAVNTARPEDTLQHVFESIVVRTPKPVAEQSLDELAATLQVLEWLPANLIETAQSLPDVATVKRYIDLKTLRAPFEALATDKFRGRANELATLRDYVGVREPSSISARVTRGLRELFSQHERPPLVIYAPGGMGKSTVLSRFILEHTAESSGDRLPFIYLDCDRPGLVPEEPLTLLIEGVRQLGIQFPSFSQASRDWVARWQSSAVPAEDDPDAPSLSVRNRAEFLEASKLFIEDLNLGDSPLLLVIDTFEEVQYRGRAYVRELWRFLTELQRLVPRLRTVVAGRARVDEPCEELPLGSLDDESAVGFLEASGVTNRSVAQAVARQVRRNPLSLRLAAQVLRYEEPVGSRIEDLDTGGGLRKKLDDNRIQGELFRRILSHVTREDVRKLAHPGLVLRRITPELIKDVLAKPCNVRVDTQQQADELFDALRREVSLVTAASSGREVRHRPDVRRVMLELLRTADPKRVRRIEESAVAYYEKLATTDPGARAEEIYHRLGLGQDEKQISLRWMPGLEEYLRNAIDDFSGLQQALLATLLGIELHHSNNEQLPDTEWQLAVEKQARDLLRLGRTDEALALMRSRQLPARNTSLRALEAQVLSAMGRVREARLIAKQALRATQESPHPQDLELQRIIAQADDILGDPLTEEDPVARYSALAKLLPHEPAVLELGAQWYRILRRSATDSPPAHAIMEQLRAAIDDSVALMPDEVLRDSPWLLRQLRDDQVVESPEQVQRIAELLPGRAGTGVSGLTRSSLTTEQRRLVRDALITHFPTASELDSLVRESGARGLYSIVPANSTLAESVNRVLAWAEAEGLVGELLDAALGLRPDSIELEEVQARLDVVHYSSADPTHSLLVDGASPFVGRNVLRQFIAYVGHAKTPNVLLVNGPRGTGKSYSLRLISYVARSGGQFDFAAVNAEQGVGVEALAAAIGQAGGWTAESLPNSTEPMRRSQYLRLLQQWVLAHARKRRKPLVLAVDNLDQVTGESIEFVAALAEGATSLSGDAFNLVLLGFSPASLTPKTRRDRVLFEELSALTQTDISEFLSAILAGRSIEPHALDLVRRTALSRLTPLIGTSQKGLNEFLGNAVRDLLL